jgi:RNA polymerase sigma-70 factor (ECF subfamily)
VPETHDGSGADIDVEAYYRRYGPMVYRRCLRLLRDPQRAEDAMHDVFVELLVDRERLRGQSPSSLLYRIATHVSLNRLRSQRRRPEDGDALLALVAGADDAEGRGVAAAVLARLFGRHDVSSRVIATLHFVDGLTLAEVAREVGLSVSGVRKRIQALRARLRGLEATT